MKTLTCAMSLLAAIAPCLAAAPPCAPGWGDAFLHGAIGASTDKVIVFDFGEGPRLVAAAEFTDISGLIAPGMAAWDGKRWTQLPGFGKGFDFLVESFAVFDDGEGPALYAAYETYVYRLGENGWTTVGGDFNAEQAGGGWVYSLAVLDDGLGSGPALYAGGNFVRLHGTNFRYIAKWTGSAWINPGNPPYWEPADGEQACAVDGFLQFDDGAGNTLFAMCDLCGYVEEHVRWNGEEWLPFPNNDPDSLTLVDALAVFDGGDGPALHAAGTFRFINTYPARGIAKWDGSVWSEVGGGVGGYTPQSYNRIYAMGAFDLGQGPSLYIAGKFLEAGGVPVNRVARWDGAAWSPLGAGVGLLNTNPLSAPHHSPRSLTLFDDGSGPRVYVAGAFPSVGNVVPSDLQTVSWSEHEDGANGSIAAWDGERWSALGSSPSGVPENGVLTVEALAVADIGGTEALIIAGRFPTLGPLAANNIGAWDGEEFAAFGAGVGGLVNAVEPFEGHIYAAGDILSAGGAPAERIARWNGAEWLAMPGVAGSSPEVFALRAWDDGAGADLYVGGAFTSAGGVEAANRIARWDGDAWSGLDDGFDGSVQALAIFDDGSGEALYAGGGFTSAGATTLDSIARWDGSAWSGVGGGMNGAVRALVVADLGDGPALYAGGAFTEAGGVSANRVARWDGKTWSALGAGVSGQVEALAVFDDGSGTALYVGGRFKNAGGNTVERVARWDGDSWTDLEGGFGDGAGVQVSALAGFGASLAIGGTFYRTTSGEPTVALAEWRGCAEFACPGDLDGDAFVGFSDLNIVISAFNTSGSNLTGDADQDGDVDFADLNIVLSTYNSAC